MCNNGYLAGNILTELHNSDIFIIVNIYIIKNTIKIS